MAIQRRYFFAMMLGIAAFCKPLSAATIHNYQPIFVAGFSENGQPEVAFRAFEEDGELRFVVVDAQTLKTRIIAAKNLRVRGTSSPDNLNGYVTAAEFENTRYERALQYYATEPYGVSNAGLTHGPRDSTGVALTVDMCPSVKPFEKEFFSTLVTWGAAHGRSVPVAISITGMWVLQHPEEWAWLLQQQATHQLDITWVNHTFSHAYFADVPPERNFLLYADTQVASEVLLIEQMLVEAGQVPSVFFRAPGLVTNEALIRDLRHLGLIVVGADAWLAKGENPVPGSIILVHGNANEPQGIERFYQILADGADLDWLPIQSMP